MASIENYSEILLKYDKVNEALEAYAKYYVDEQSDGAKLIHKEVAIKKIIVTVIYAFLLFTIPINFIFYHSYEFRCAALLFVISAAWFYAVSTRFVSEKALLHKMKEMPDAEIDSILASESDNFWKARYVWESIAAIIAGTILVMVIAYWSPHMIFERNSTGYGLRFYTLSLNPDAKVVIPDTYKGLPVTEIRGDVFYNIATVREIQLPKGITEIRGSTFEQCVNLENIDIPEGVTRIGGHAFRDCKSLKHVVIPSTVKRISSSAFRNCLELQSVVIPKGVTEIGGHVFQDCYALRSVRIPSTLSVISESAFRNCTHLERIILPKGVTAIGENAFRDCSRLSYVRVPFTVKMIRRCAFRGCTQLREIILPRRCIEGESLFRDSGTKKIYR